MNVHILNRDGNLIDCASHSLLAALLHFRLPQTVIEEDETIQILDPFEKNPSPLSLLYHPICISFAFFVNEISPVLLLDPSYVEEKLANGLLTLCIDPIKKELCTLHKRGLPLPLDILNSTLEYGLIKSIELSNLIKSTIPK